MRFDLGAPTPDMVDFDAMATVLARIPRFTGHTKSGVYSVAQHCVEGAYAILRDMGEPSMAAAFLLHDGHEYVIGDLATPIQHAIGFYAGIVSGDPDAEIIVRRAVKALKANLDEAIYTAAGIEWPLPAPVQAIVKEYDVRMMRTERDACLAEPPEPWIAECEQAVPVAGVDLGSWGKYAEEAFRIACDELLPNRVDSESK
jgi:hypothetical protein